MSDVRQPDQISPDEDNPEWSESDFARARGPESLPPEVLAAFPRTRPRGRPPVGDQAKEAIKLRLDADVLQYFRSTGPGWQTRINGVLRNAMSKAV